MSIGFGLERIGFYAIRFPKISALLLFLFTALCVAQFANYSVDGDLLRIYRGDNVRFQQYEKLVSTFGTYEDDVYFMVRSDDLGDPEVLERLREFSFELELNDFAAGVLSPFALRTPVSPGVTEPAVDENMSDKDQILTTLTGLRESDPIMHNLIFDGIDGMVMILFPNPEVFAEAGDRAMIASMYELIDEFQSDKISIEITGPSIWKLEVLDAVFSDQFKFVGMGMALGFIAALLMFRSVIGALLATLTPFISVVWLVGIVILLFDSFTFLTNIMTVLVLVIAFAESVFFCMHWLRLSQEGMEPDKAIDETLARVSPACALTSVTTIIAFMSLYLTGNQGIRELAVVGSLSIALAFVAMVVFLPLLLKFALHLGHRPKHAPSVALSAVLPFAQRVAFKRGKIVSVVAIVGFIALLYPHFNLEPRFSFRDFLPKNSAALATARNIDNGVGGVAPIYAMITLSDGNEEMSDRDFDTITRVHEILESVVGDGKVISAASFSYYLDSGFSKQQIFEGVGPFLKRRFVTDDGSKAMVTGFLPTDLTSENVREIIADIENKLASDAGVEVGLSGFQVLSAFESANIIQRLQNGLSFAVVISIFVIGLAFRSVKVAVLCIVPNFLPILGTELFVYVSGIHLQMTSVIALTISFGIAVDDTIHFLNHYMRARAQGYGNREAVTRTLSRVGPALIATTVILCIGCGTIIFSALPQVALFGGLTVITLILALLGDLFILPAMLIAGGRFFNSIGETK